MIDDDFEDQPLHRPIQSSSQSNHPQKPLSSSSSSHSHSHSQSNHHQSDDFPADAPNAISSALSFLHERPETCEAPRTSIISDIVKLNKKQQYALDVIISGESVFITGPSGSGKSTIIASITKELRARGDNVSITCAGLNGACDIGGQTLQSFCGVKKLDDERKNLDKQIRIKFVQTIWNEIDVIIIDDVSLLTCREFQNILYIAHVARTKSSVLQWVLIGDFLSTLPRDNRPQDGANAIDKQFPFQLKEWGQLIHRTIYLDEDMRRNDCGNPDEQMFSTILNNMRLGFDKQIKWTSDFQKQLDNRPVRQPSTRLHTKFEVVDAENNQNLKKLPTPEFSFTAQKGYRIGNQLCPLHLPKSREHLSKDVLRVMEKISVNEFKKTRLLRFLEKFAVVDETLLLRVGAVVILMANLHIGRRLVKGAQGIVTGFTKSQPHYPIVKFEHCQCVVRSFMWSLDYSQETKMWYAQIPLKLGWAHSIYRMRGMTMDHIEVDMRDLYGPGQVYDVLSKVRTLSSIFFISVHYSTIKANPECVVFYETGLFEWDAGFEKWKGRKEKAGLPSAPSNTGKQTFAQSDNIPKSAFSMDSLSGVCGFRPSQKQEKHRDLTKPTIQGQKSASAFVENDDQYDDDDDDDDRHDDASEERIQPKRKQNSSHLRIAEFGDDDADDDDDTDEHDDKEKRHRISETSDSNGGVSSTTTRTPLTPHTGDFS